MSQIAINPQNSKIIYAQTTYTIGVLKSTDDGETWTQINRGIRSYSIYQMALDPKNPKTVYLGVGGAGLMKSTDEGASWVEMNDGLQNTDIGQLQLDPDDSEIIYVVTSRGLFKSPDGGKSWIPLNQRDDFTESQQFQSLIIMPSKPRSFFLASKKGLYKRTEGDSGWVPVGEPFAGKIISALARDTRTGRLYAAIFRRGTIETLHEGGLFISDDNGTTWSRQGSEFSGDWVRVILIDPLDSKILYVGATGRGVMKSVDGGVHWKETNNGLTDPDLDIHTLAFDPNDNRILYAGSHGDWIFRSRDGGASWTHLPLGPHSDAQQLLAELRRQDELARREATVRPPPEFKKCNRCHGWTDLKINLGKGSWRVAANRRDWKVTVKRMSKGAGLTPDEEEHIANFLNEYTGGESVEAQPTLQAHEIQISDLKEHEEEDPVTGWDGTNYMAVWQSNRKDPDDYNLFATRIRPDGHVVDSQAIPLSTAPSNQIFADIAPGDGQYLVVWQDLRSGRRWEIYGARVRADGKVLDPDGIPIASGRGNAQYPQVAWGRDSFLVVWMEENEGQGWNVAGARISANGTKLDPNRIPISQAPGDQIHPSIAWSGTEYLVAWADNRPGAPGRISAIGLDESGNPIDSREILIPGSGTDASDPAVAWAHGRFVIVWIEKPAPNTYALSGAQIVRTGQTVQTRGFSIFQSPNLLAFPSIACSPRDCLAVWEEDQPRGRPIRSLVDIRRDVRGSILDFSGAVIDPSRDFIIADKAVGNHFAKAETDNQGFLVVWKDYRSGTAASLGRLVTPP